LANFRLRRSRRTTREPIPSERSCLLFKSIKEF